MTPGEADLCPITSTMGRNAQMCSAWDCAGESACVGCCSCPPEEVEQLGHGWSRQDGNLGTGFTKQLGMITDSVLWPQRRLFFLPMMYLQGIQKAKTAFLVTIPWNHL